MDDLKKLAGLLLRELPAAELKLDLPREDTGFGWLDIDDRGMSVAVEWRRGRGFGVSLLETAPEDPSLGLFEGPHEVFDDMAGAREYILRLLQTANPRADLRRAARG
jgi:hypothetical protein